MTEEEKRALKNARQRGINAMWRNEAELVKQGRGTREWTPAEQEQLLRNGTVQGYQVHHQHSAMAHSDNVELAADVNNLQILSKEEHIAAHNGSWRNPTHGYYDYQTKSTVHTECGQKYDQPVYDLSKSNDSSYTQYQGQDMEYKTEYDNDYSMDNGEDNSNAVTQIYDMENYNGY